MLITTTVVAPSLINLGVTGFTALALACAVCLHVGSVALFGNLCELRCGAPCAQEGRRVVWRGATFVADVIRAANLHFPYSGFSTEILRLTS